MSRPPRTVEAVLFDLDGVLVDSEPVWSIAEREVIEWLGGTWGPEVKAALVGNALDEASRLLLEFAGADRPVGEVAERLSRRIAELFEADGGLTVPPGAAELLAALRAASVPLALVSSSSRRLVEAALRLLGREHFQVPIAGDEVTERKPLPAPYLAAAERLGVDPSRCVAVEDSPTGVQAAEAAGCVVVAVPDHRLVTIPPGPRRHVVRSLAAVDPAWLLSLATP